MGRELLLHGGEVVLHLLPTGTSYSTNSPKKKSIYSSIVCVLWYTGVLTYARAVIK